MFLFLSRFFCARCFLGLFSVLSLLYSAHTFAHPHSFIGLKTKLHLRNEQLSGFTFSWTMDAMTSADILYELEGLDENDKAWKKMSSNIMVNVLSQHYFTTLYAQGKSIPFYPLPDKHRLIRENNQLILEFTVSLLELQPLAGETLELYTYDPSFFMDMSYPNRESIELPERLLTLCDVTLVEPNPSASMIAYAAAFDLDETIDADDQFGRHFAQKVVIRCE